MKTYLEYVQEEAWVVGKCVGMASFCVAVVVAMGFVVWAIGAVPTGTFGPIEAAQQLTSEFITTAAWLAIRYRLAAAAWVLSVALLAVLWRAYEARKRDGRR